MLAVHSLRVPKACTLSVACVIAVSLFVTCATSSEVAAQVTGRFVDRVYRDSQGDHKYVVFEPAGYNASKKWPLIMYLHGASGRGTDGRAMLVVGMGPAVKHRAATLPFLVVFPQCENLNTRLLGGWHEDPQELDRALKILESVESSYTVDRGHEVLVGTSMGGFGVWDLAARDPKRWRAVAPISGGGADDMIPALTKVPVWAFHALDDTLVPPSRSSDLVAGIKNAGGSAYVSLLPNGGHNISKAVLARDEVFEWFLHPEHEPKLDIDWTEPRELPSLMDQLQFVPGAEVSQAVQMHIGRDLLQSWAALLPQLIPADTLAGWKPGTAESSAAGLFSFNVTTGGVQYTGVLEQATIEPLPPNRMRVQLGLRSMQMTILSTHVRGRLFAADAGPMTIYIGYNAPVWLTADLAPRIADRRLHMDVVGVDFQIPADNWSVTQPDVNVRGLRFLRNRITTGLVEGVSEKRPLIEAEIRNSVPGMLAKMEQQIADRQKRVVSFGNWPMPLWQPRFQFYPETLRIGENGIDLAMGAVVAQLGTKPPGQPLKFAAENVPTPAAPKEGLEFAISERLVTAWSALLAGSNVNRFDVLDMNSPEFRRLGEREFWNEVLPAVRDLPENTELKTEFALMQPLDLRDWKPDGKPGLKSDLGIAVPQLRLELSERQTGERAFRLYAAFDLALSQGFHASVVKASFVRRNLEQELLPAERPQIRPHLLPPGVAAESVDLDKIASQFERGWEKNFETDMRTAALKDVVIAKLPLRWNEVGWDGARLVARWNRPGILIVNGTHAPVSYMVRGMTTVWSDPLQLPAGQSHEFRPATGLVWQQAGVQSARQFQLSLGEAFDLREEGRTTANADVR